jgi:hypothetical protein
MIESEVAQHRKFTAAHAVLAIAAFSLLVWGGFALTHRLECQALEADYLNSVSAMKQAIMVRQIAPDSRAMANVSSALVEDEFELLESLTSGIYDRCGQRAGRTAYRKGSELLLGSN